MAAAFASEAERMAAYRNATGEDGMGGVGGGEGALDHVTDGELMKPMFDDGDGEGEVDVDVDDGFDGDDVDVDGDIMIDVDDVVDNIQRPNSVDIHARSSNSFATTATATAPATVNSATNGASLTSHQQHQQQQQLRNKANAVAAARARAATAKVGHLRPRIDPDNSTDSSSSSSSRTSSSSSHPNTLRAASHSNLHAHLHTGGAGAGIAAHGGPEHTPVSPTPWEVKQRLFRRTSVLPSHTATFPSPVPGGKSKALRASSSSTQASTSTAGAGAGAGVAAGTVSAPASNTSSNAFSWRRAGNVLLNRDDIDGGRNSDVATNVSVTSNFATWGQPEDDPELLHKVLDDADDNDKSDDDDDGSAEIVVIADNEMVQQGWQGDQYQLRTPVSPVSPSASSSSSAMGATSVRLSPFTAVKTVTPTNASVKPVGDNKATTGVALASAAAQTQTQAQKAASPNALNAPIVITEETLMIDDEPDDEAAASFTLGTGSQSMLRRSLSLVQNTNKAGGTHADDGDDDDFFDNDG